MKVNFLKYASLLLIAGSLLVSCDEDTVVYNGADYVQFKEAITTTLSVTEASGTVTVPVSLTTPQSSEVSVGFTITSTNATEGTDYVILTPTVVFAAGETEKNIQIQVINDDEFNLAKVLVVTLTSATNNIGVGLAGMAGASVKTISISNDDYDCDTDFNYWLGNLTVTDGSDTFSATGSGGAECNVLTVKGDLAGWSTPDRDEYEITFVEGGSSSEGTVSVSTVVDDVYEYNATTNFIIKYEGEGTYDTETGEIVIEYSINAYVGSANQGYFSQGTTVIKLAN